MYFLGGRGLSNGDIEVARDTVLSGDTAGRELVSKPAISSTKSWGGATIERLTPYVISSPPSPL